jgi:cation:H+ antiporter
LFSLSLQSLPVTLGVLIGAAVVIYLACEYFVNGIEWVGRKLAVGQKATGTILAAFGTALPESVVTLVAVAFGGGKAGKDIGVGAAMGGPLVLGTLAYAVVGLTLLVCRRRLPAGADSHGFYNGLSRDQGWFVILSLIKLAVGFSLFAVKPWLGLVFLAAYIAYAWKELAGGDDFHHSHELEPLKLAKTAASPKTWLVLVQTGVALVVIFIASRVFVGRIDALGPVLGLKPQLLALLLSPIATELPETLNAVIWVRQGKVKLALANISGAMMIQAAVPTAFGLFFTTWVLDPPVMIAGAVTVAAVSILFLALRARRISRLGLMALGLVYLVFLGLLFGLRL